MPLVLVRIDDRLIHGQVVVGWGNFLKPDRIILCSDSVATIPWQKELFSAAATIAPKNLSISIWTELETIEYFNQEHYKEEKVILLVESPQELLNLIDRGAPIKKVNIGGMHFKQGKRQLAPYIFVNNDDLAHFRILKDRNIRLEGQNVPTADKIDVADMLDLI